MKGRKKTGKKKSVSMEAKVIGSKNSKSDEIIKHKCGNFSEAKWNEIVDRMVIRFKEALIRNYPTIDKFVEGESTKKLSEIIPLEFLRRLVWHYRLFHLTTQRPEFEPTYPKREIQQIDDILIKFKRRKWLRNDRDMMEIKDLIIIRLLKSERGSQLMEAQEKGKHRKKGGPLKDYSLDFLIYILVGHAKSINRRKPRYSLIADFLNEQEVEIQQKGDNRVITIDEEIVRKRYKRVDINRTWMIFNTVPTKTLDSMIKGYLDTFPSQFGSKFVGSLFPDFIEFLPLEKRT